MKETKTKITLSVLIISSVLLVVVGSSLAYLSSNSGVIREGKREFKDVDTTTIKDLKLIFSDCKDSESTCKEINKDLALGESVSKDFKITNSSAYDLKYTLFFGDILNNFKNDELVYKLESLSTGKVLVEKPLPYREYMDIDVPILEDIEIKVDEVQNYRITVTFLNKDYNQNENWDAEYYFTVNFIESNREKVPGVNQYARLSTPNYSTPSTSDEGIYEGVDNYGKTYYYRGDVKNNYVNFANLYWRIIRVNGNGSLRLMYDGTMPHENSDTSDDRVVKTLVPWSNEYSDVKYVGYTYSNSTPTTSVEDAVQSDVSSVPKTVVDAWYKENIVDKGYAEFVDDTIFCGDRSVSTGNGFGNGSTYFNGYKRLRNGTGPVFTCSPSSSYTVSNSIGNGNLEYPVGLISADEAMAAGVGAYNTGTTRSYLYRGNWYWTMTPDSYDNQDGFMFYVDGGNLAKLSLEKLESEGSIVPVLNIKSSYVKGMSGDGTIYNPYVIQ